MQSKQTFVATKHVMTQLACALALLTGASAACAAPSSDWSLFLSSPESQTLRMLPNGQTRAVPDDHGGVRLVALDGDGPSPNTLRTQAINPIGQPRAESVVVAKDYAMGSAVDLTASGDYYALTHRSVSGTKVQTWYASETQPQTALAFALAEPEAVLAIRVTAGGDTLLVRRVRNGSRQMQLVAECYGKAGKLDWSRNLGVGPAGAVAMTESGHGQIALSYLANRDSFSRAGGAVSDLISVVLDVDGTLLSEQSTALDRDYQASAALITASGERYLAVKSQAKQSAICAMVAASPNSRSVSMPFRIEASRCTAPSQFSADTHGFAAVFDVAQRDADSTLLVDGDAGGERWVRALDTNQEVGSSRQVARLADGTVALAYAAADLDTVNGSMDLVVQWFGDQGELAGSNVHPNLRHGDEFAITATADGGYIVSYSSFDPSIWQAAVAVSKAFTSSRD